MGSWATSGFTSGTNIYMSLMRYTSGESPPRSLGSGAGVKNKAKWGCRLVFGYRAGCKPVVEIMVELAA